MNIRIFDKEEYDGEWFPEKATDFMGWFKGKLDQIPAEHIDSARIEIETARGYEDDCYVKLVISYSRPDTEEEISSRECENLKRDDRVREREIKLLANLKSKYE